MPTPKEKIIKYLIHKGISQDKFSRNCNVSSGFLRQGKSFSVEFLKVLREKYTDLNLDWLIYDEGEMLLEPNSLLREPSNAYKKDCDICRNLEKDLKYAEKLLEAKEETIGILKHQLGIVDKGNSKAC